MNLSIPGTSTIPSSLLYVTVHSNSTRCISPQTQSSRSLQSVRCTRSSNSILLPLSLFLSFRSLSKAWVEPYLFTAFRQCNCDVQLSTRRTPCFSLRTHTLRYFVLCERACGLLFVFFAHTPKKLTRYLYGCTESTAHTHTLPSTSFFV